MTGNLNVTSLNNTGLSSASYFTATSPTATSTFAGGFTAAGASGLTVTQNGNVGLGVTNPLNKLGVNGAVAIGSYAGVNTAPTNGLIVSGNVGVGTTSPAATLQVQGAGSAYSDKLFKITNSSGTGLITTTGDGRTFVGTDNGLNGNLVINNPSGSGKDLVILTDNNSTANPQLRILGGSNEIIYAASASTTRLSFGHTDTNNQQIVILGNGNVGIGTANPGAKLAISETTTVQPALSINHTTNSDVISVTKGSGTGNLLTATFTNAQSNGLSYSNTDASTFLQNTQVFGIKGVVSVGTDNTNTFGGIFQASQTRTSSGSNNDLAIGVDAIANSSIATAGSWGYAGRFTAGTANVVAGLFKGASSQTADIFQVQKSDGTSYLNVNSAGNVGIATTTPFEKLTINGNGYFTGTITASNFINSGNSTTTGGSIASYFTATSPTATSTFAGGFTAAGASGLTVQQGGNVGIGTTSPSQKLEVLGNIYANNGSLYAGTISTGTSVSYGIQYVNRTNLFTDLLIHNQAAQMTLYANPQSGSQTGVTGLAYPGNSSGIFTPNALVFGAGSSERLRILSNGNVGIGTTTPAENLTIQSGTPTLNLTDGSFQGYIKAQGGGTYSYLSLYSQSAGKVTIYGNPQGSNYTAPNGTTIYATSSGIIGGGYSGVGGTPFYVGAASDLRFLTNAGSERMRIDATGNVGIGTSTPGYRLDVVGGGAKFSGANIGNESQVLIAGTNGSFNAGLLFGSTNTSDLGQLKYTIGNGDLNYAYASNGSTFSNLFTVKGAGNIGIGTSTPASKLSILGNTSIGATYSGIAAPSNGLIVEGNVGIGTNAPTTPFQVGNSGSTQFQVAASGASVYVGPINGNYNLNLTSNTIQSSNSGTYNTNLNLQPLGSGNVNIGSASGNVILLPSGSGNVGIGTSTPGSKLDIWGNLNVATGTTPALFVNTATGNVGIGLSNPSTLVEANGVIRSDRIGAPSQYTEIDGGNVTGPYLNGVGANKLFNISGLDTGATAGVSTGIAFRTNTTASPIERMRIDGLTGNVGIGTTTPGLPLSVVGSALFSGSGPTLTLGTGGAPVFSIFNGTSGNFNISTNGSTGIATINNANSVGGALDFQTRGTSVLYIKENGNVGIGTSTPGSKLDVYGNLNVATGTTPALFVNTAIGNVGINTASPLNTLDINGSLSLGNKTDTTAQGAIQTIRVGSSGGSTAYIAWNRASGSNDNWYLGLPTPTASFGLRNSVDVGSILTITAGTTPGQQRAVIVGENAGNANGYLQTFNSGAGTEVNGLSLGNTSTSNNSNINIQFQAVSNSGGAPITYSKIIGVRNGTFASSTVPSGGIAFSTTNGSTSFAEVMRIGYSGNVGIGTTTPGAQLTTTGSVQFANFGAGTLQTDANGNVSVSSDERLKNVDGNYSRGLEDLMGINPITYHWKGETGYDTAASYAGFSAQNVQQFIPEAVGVDKRGFLTLQDRPILGALVNAVKDLGNTSSSTKSALASLQMRVATIEGLNDSLKATAGTPAPSGSLGGGLLSALQSFGSEMLNGIAYISHLFTKRLTVGSPENPNGITIYSKSGKPFCLTVSDEGAPLSTPGICQDATSTPAISGGVVTTTNSNNNTATVPDATSTPDVSSSPANIAPTNDPAPSPTPDPTPAPSPTPTADSSSAPTPPGN